MTAVGFIRVACWLGMGMLAHWLWIGSHIDVADAFDWACLLIGPPMVLGWLVMKSLWWFLLAVVVGVLGVCAWIGYDEFSRWRRRRLREKANAIARARMANSYTIAGLK